LNRVDFSGWLTDAKTKCKQVFDTNNEKGFPDSAGYKEHHNRVFRLRYDVAHFENEVWHRDAVAMGLFVGTYKKVNQDFSSTV